MSFKDRLVNTSVQFLNEQRAKLKQTDVWQSFMGAGAVSGHVQPQQSPNLGSPKTSTSSANMTCEACGTNFTIFKRRKICMDCSRQLCSTCLPKEPNRPSNQRRCDQCSFLNAGIFTRHDLEKFKVKHMKNYLDKHNIPTRDCKEKNDLIELLMHFSRHSQHFRDLEEHQRHFQTLQERMRENSTLGGGNNEVANIDSSSSSSGTATPTEQHATPSLPRHQQPLENSQPPAPSQPPESSTETEEERLQRQERRRQQEMRETELRLYHELHDDEAPDLRPKREKMSIDKVATEENIENLTIRELKEILSTNYVDYKGCVEKPELIERVKRLWHQSQNKDEGNKEVETDECKICMDAVIDCVLLECGHMVTCTSCGRRLAECPVCRQYVSRVVHTFKA